MNNAARPGMGNGPGPNTFAPPNQDQENMPPLVTPDSLFELSPVGSDPNSALAIDRIRHEPGDGESTHGAIEHVKAAKYTLDAFINEQPELKRAKVKEYMITPEGVIEAVVKHGWLRRGHSVARIRVTGHANAYQNHPEHNEAIDPSTPVIHQAENRKSGIFRKHIAVDQGDTERQYAYNRLGNKRAAMRIGNKQQGSDYREEAVHVEPLKATLRSAHLNRKARAHAGSQSENAVASHYAAKGGSEAATATERPEHPEQPKALSEDKVVTTRHYIGPNAGKQAPVSPDNEKILSHSGPHERRLPDAKTGEQLQRPKTRQGPRRRSRR